MSSLVRTCKWRVVGNEKLQINPRRQYWRKVSGLYLRRGSALLQRSFFLIERRSHIPYNVFFLFTQPDINVSWLQCSQHFKAMMFTCGIGIFFLTRLQSRLLEAGADGRDEAQAELSRPTSSDDDDDDDDDDNNNDDEYADEYAVSFIHCLLYLDTKML